MTHDLSGWHYIIRNCLHYEERYKERCLVLEEVTALVSVCCKMPLDNDILMYQGENDAQGVWSYIP